MAHYKYNKMWTKQRSHKSLTGQIRKVFTVQNQPITKLFKKRLLVAAIGAALSQNLAQANPVGGKVVAGSAQIVNKAPGKLEIIQKSNKAIIDWRGFSIGRGEHTRFRQPSSSSIALNRVRGGQASLIDGILTANGNVWLINPNGVLFGKSAQVNVRGLLATTSDINNEDFMAGRYAFNKPTDNIDAAIVNQGQIEVTDGGSIVLAGKRVSNKGSIKARLGHVILASGDTFTMDFEGDGLLQFDIGDPVQQPNSDDSTEALVANSGQITVDGGIVEMTAKTRNTMMERVINMDGVIQARAVDVKGGTIILSGGEEGIVAVSGKLDVSGKEPDEIGGEVKVLGEKVALVDDAEIDASGDAGGGEVLVGGNYQGKGSEPNARRTLVTGNTKINADALTKGDGGKVVLWADEMTAFSGDISAKGGKHSGEGGLVEVSGKQDLIFRGQVDLNSAQGKKGSLLLDPFNITVTDGAGREFLDDGELSDNQILAGDGVSFITISEQKLESLSGTADIILEATNDIAIKNLSDGILAFQASTGSVTFSADADKDGRGTFSLSDVELQTQGGNLTIEAADMLEEGVSSEIITKGGDINLISRNNFNMSFLSLDSSVSGSVSPGPVFGVPVAPGIPGVVIPGVVSSSKGGNISVQASSDIVLTGRPLNIDSSGRTQGGNISLTSSNGKVDIGHVDASSTRGAGGKIDINSQSNISTGDLTSTGASAGGDVKLTSTRGSIDTRFATEFPPLNPIKTSATSGSGGNVELTAAELISIGAIDATGSSSNGGKITLTANEIDLTGSLVSSGGSVLLQPLSPTQNIVIGGDRDPDSSSQTQLDITKNDLAFLNEPFGSLTIGRDNGSGSITIVPDGVNFNQTTTIRSPETNGNIFLSGPVQTASKDLTFKAGNTLQFSNEVSTKGGNLSINGDSVLASATKISTAGGDIDFNGQINSSDKPADLTLLAEAGDIQFNGSVGTEKPLGSVNIDSANNVTINSKFVAGDTKVIHRGDFTTGPDGFVELESLFVNPEAKSVDLKGTVAGAAEKETALVVEGPKDDPNFIINDCVVGVSCSEEPETPEPETPEPETPEPETPEPETPEPETPEPETPEPETPEPETPEPETPEPETPEPETPEPETPEPETPEPETPEPETPEPETPEPETPEPETPEPETPEPETPEPETPEPETPEPETPEPETPGPETPEPETPGPETPGPETPEPETPEPETPEPETPEPETPEPETPGPETPEPETPGPETPGPETPEPETPGPETPGPETPGPETPGPETPGPETPGPETPGPETPGPETPGPETPGPETPGPETPGPETPGPETPGPETPGPETPGPETPGPETPGPETPGPETPGPETPGPETPGPETPGPETPGPETPEANLNPELPTEAEPRPDNPKVTDVVNIKPGDIATSPEVLTVMQTRRPSNNPAVYQYSNFGNTEMWDDVPSARSISSFAAFSPVATEKDKKDDDDSKTNDVEQP